MRRGKTRSGTPGPSGRTRAIRARRRFKRRWARRAQHELTLSPARHNVIAFPEKEEPVHIDRRAFLATLGSAAVVEAMSPEARADALEHYMIAQLDKPAAAPAQPLV